jgi:hypothetical protein
VTMLAPVVAIFTSMLFGVDQAPSLLSILGITSILLGLYVLHFNPRKYGLNLMGPIKEIWLERGNWLIYAVALAICGGCAIPIDKRHRALRYFYPGESYIPCARPAVATSLRCGGTHQ